jgi:Flp pilus assembly protein TadD
VASAAHASAAPNPPAPPEAARPAPRTADTAYHEGVALFEQGKHREALAKFQECVHLDSRYAEAYKKLGQVWMRLGDTDTGRKYYAKYLELRPDQEQFIRPILNPAK